MAYCTAMAGVNNLPAPSTPKETTRPKSSSKKFAETIQSIVNIITKPLKLFFQDESRFGRISQTTRCWAPQGERPIVPKQIIREYTYAYTAACPQDGTSVSLILPDMRTECFNIFLKELSDRHPNEHIILVLDGAASHRSKTQKLPENISLIPLPPYSPELNPIENFWKVLKQQGFYNQAFDSLDQVEDLLEAKLKHFEDHPEKLQSIVGYQWIVSATN